MSTKSTLDATALNNIKLEMPDMSQLNTVSPMTHSPAKKRVQIPDNPSDLYHGLRTRGDKTTTKSKKKASHMDLAVVSFNLWKEEEDNILIASYKRFGENWKEVAQAVGSKNVGQ